MDRHKVQSNRHKQKEKFPSGHFKRKARKEKDKKTQEILSKTRRMTDYMAQGQGSSAAPPGHDDDYSNSIAQPSHQQPCDSTDGEKLPDPEIAAPANDSLPVASEMTTPGTSETTPAILGTGTTPETPGTTLQQTSQTKPSSGASLGPESNLSEISKLEADIGLWPELMTPGNIDYCIKMGASVFQNCDKDQDLFEKKSVKQIDGPSSKTFTRRCQTSFFVRIKRNKERVQRSWLCFSPSNGRVFCFVCKLFSRTQSQFTDGGFCDWKNAKGRLSDHETSKSHLNATIHFAARSKEIGRIDQELIRQAEEEGSYWREIVKRLISVIMFISERGLAFRGENETLGSPKNGNYLGILELIAEYDSFLAKHIQNLGNRGRGHSNYLSSTICEEIVEILGKQVFDEIISRIKQSKYFSVSLDSTPDEAHIDQLTLIFRYLEGHNPVERFVKFMPNKGHKAKDMFNALKNFLDENGLDIKDCRGQSYDNASSMSGKYNGLQALVLAENTLAIWVPCAAHSLNLVVQDAAKSCLSAVSFFDFLEELYVYFTGSTNRYKVLTDTLKKAQTDKPILVPQRTTTTRWSCRADATKALVAGYKEIKSALFEISEDKEDSGKSRITALSLHNKMTKIEVGILAVFWNDILGQVNKVSETLQNPRLDVNTAASALASLKSLIASKRDSFKEYELKAAELIGSNDYEGETQRKRKINVRLAPLGSESDQAKPVDLTPSEKFRTQTFIPIVDQFEFSLEKRLQSYRLVDDRFGVLRKMDSLTDEEITVAAKTLVETYDNDLDDQLANELIQFKSFYQDFQKDEKYKKAKISKERWMYELLIEKNVEDCFPNVEVTLRMYLSLMITNSSGERSFSKLKLIKNRLRTSMLEERLNYLALMSIECDILRKLNYDNVIEEFVNLKSRRKPFNTSTITNN